MGDEVLTPGRSYVGLVTKIESNGSSAEVLIGKQKARLPALGMRWARARSTPSSTTRARSSTR
jgi:penicillin-binding protein 1A